MHGVIRGIDIGAEPGPDVLYYVVVDIGAKKEALVLVLLAPVYGLLYELGIYPPFPGLGGGREEHPFALVLIHLPHCGETQYLFPLLGYEHSLGDVAVHKRVLGPLDIEVVALLPAQELVVVEMPSVFLERMPGNGLYGV